MNQENKEIFNFFLKSLEERTANAIKCSNFMSSISFCKYLTIEHFQRLLPDEVNLIISFIEFKIYKEGKFRFGFKLIRDNLNEWLTELEGGNLFVTRNDQ